jgi:hypothetical protein
VLKKDGDGGGVRILEGTRSRFIKYHHTLRIIECHATLEIVGNTSMGNRHQGGASIGGSDHEDGIWISFVLHRPYRPRSAYD